MPYMIRFQQAYGKRRHLTSVSSFLHLFSFSFMPERQLHFQGISSYLSSTMIGSMKDLIQRLPKFPAHTTALYYFLFFLFHR